MNKEKAELYAMLFARAFLVAETSDNGGENMDEKEFEELSNYAKWLLDDIEEHAEKWLTKEEYEYYQEITDFPQRNERE